MDSDVEEYETNNELFLRMVCNYPAIYNPESRAYSNRVLKETAFENIARSLDMTVEECKKRWKSLREKYHRQKNKIEAMTRSGAPASQLVEWPYMSFFQYMFDNISPRSTTTSLFENTTSSFNLNHPIPMGTFSNIDSDTEETMVSSQDTMLKRNFSINENLPRNLPFARKKMQKENSASFANSKTEKPSENCQNILMNTNLCRNESTPKTINKRNIKPPHTANICDKDKANKRRRAPEVPVDPFVSILDKVSNTMEEAVSKQTKKTESKIDDFATYLCAELREFSKERQEEFIDETIIRMLQMKRKK